MVDLPPPLVSIIIPSYDYAAFINETLDSLLVQSYPYWEAIIVDDGSTDDTEQVVRSYTDKDSRFIYIYQVNQGPSAARNSGLKSAKGVYVHFLDADDLMSKEKLEAQVQFMETNRVCDISYTDAYYFKDKKNDEWFKDSTLQKKINHWIPKLNARGAEALSYLIKSNIMPTDSALIRRAFLLKHGLYFNESYKFVEDWEFWLRCAYRGALYKYFENPLAYVLIRVHSGSLIQNQQQMQQYEIKLRYEIKDYLRRHAPASYFKKINDKFLDKLFYKTVFRRKNRTWLSSVKFLVSVIGWLRSGKVLLSELNKSRKERWRKLSHL